MLKVTDVKINKVKNMGKIVAFVKIVLDDSICIDGIKLINGEKGLFIGMPSRKVKEEFKDVVFPINSDARKVMTDAILAEYNSSEPF